MTRPYRPEEQAWYAAEKARCHAAQLHMQEVAREHQPYRAEPDCTHPVIVEVQCDYQPRPWLNTEGQACCGFNVRTREFACLSCGVGMWPADDAVRANAQHIPRCTRPLCDCDYLAPLGPDPMDPIQFAEVPR